MKDNFSNLPQRELNVHWYIGNNDLDLSYHSLGIGGIHPDPPNENIIKNTAKLKPGIIRIFLQEFFYVCKGKGKYDWSKLDAYMDAVLYVSGLCLRCIYSGRFGNISTVC